MRCEWEERTIEDCASPESYSTQIGPFGKALMAYQYKPSGIPVLRGVNVNRGRFHDDDFVFVDEVTADRLAKFESFPGDVLLVHKGTLGQIGFMPRERRFDRYILGNSMMRVRCDESKLLSGFLYYWLSSGEGQHYLLSRVSQVGVPQLQKPLTTLREARLMAPCIPEQRAIAHILGTLDDKIELNRRMSETLEEMARALFKSWFVDFDPVRAKAEGRDPGLPKEIADLFPDSFEDSELGEIPKGWEVRTLSGWADSMSGGTPSKTKPHLWRGDIPWVSPKTMKSIHADEVDSSVSESAIGNGTRLAPKGATLVMVRGMGLHQGVRVSQARSAVSFNQDVKALVGVAIEPTLLFFALLNAQKCLHQCVESSGHGTGKLPSEVLLSQLVVMPKEPGQSRLSAAFISMNDRIEIANQQSRSIAALRDTLLPKLISGELRVPDAEKFVEAAL